MPGAGNLLQKQPQNTLWQGKLQVSMGGILLRQEKLDTAFKVLKAAKIKQPKKNGPCCLPNWAMCLKDEVNLAGPLIMQ